MLRSLLAETFSRGNIKCDPDVKQGNKCEALGLRKQEVENCRAKGQRVLGIPEEGRPFATMVLRESLPFWLGGTVKVAQSI